MLTMFKTTLKIAQKIVNVQKDVQNCQKHVCKHKNIKVMIGRMIMTCSKKVWLWLETEIIKGTKK